MYYIDQFIEYLYGEISASKNSVLAYHKDILQYISFLLSFGKEPLLACTADIEMFAEHSFSNNMSSRTISRKLSAIRSYYRFLFTEKIITQNPSVTISLPKYRSELPQVISIDEMKSLINSSYSDDMKKQARFIAMISLMYATGMRISELISLRISDVWTLSTNSVRDQIILSGKGGKERVVILNNTAMNNLSNHIRHNISVNEITNPHSYLFPSRSLSGHITRQQFFNILKQASISAGLDHTNISPHTIRHTFATHMLNGGADLRVIQALLGHESINTTQIYTHLHYTKLEIAISKHPLAKFSTSKN